MLFHLLYPLSNSYGFLNIWRYQTFRAMVAFLVSFLFVLFMQPRYIAWLKKRGLRGQPVREEVTQHGAKVGTPTMGGLVVVAGVLFTSLLLADLRSVYVWLTLGVMVTFAGLGFVDDWRKITKQNTKGVSGKGKLLCQAGFSAAAGIALICWGFPDTLTIPFIKGLEPSLGLLFIPFVMLVVVGTSNAVNLTDGLDGLAIGPIMTVAGLYGLIAYLTGHKELAMYLGVTHVPDVGELSIVMSAIVAGGLGFLWYNTFPAQVFMGDFGSLSLGATLGFAAVLVKQEILLVFAGAIFVIEALSVIIQVYSFKLTGKRVFKMAPVHHHFELLGWAEPKIIVRFWIVSIVMAILSLATLKIR
jgi:phospho-N-acetylmuramoyl-pentapeptide-transferase